MNPETLVKLIDAGFTKQEIMELTGKPITEPTPAPAAAAPDPEPAPAAAAPDPEPAPAAPAAPAQDENSIETRLDGIENSIKDMMKSFQAENVRRDSFNNVPAETLESQTDKIMMSIIRPEKKVESK